MAIQGADVTITPGNYSTETNDMRAVHGALRRALGSADALVAGAGNDPVKVATVSSFYENVLEFLHVHHEGEDKLVYPLLLERCPEKCELISRIDKQHTLLKEPMAAAKSAIFTWRSDPMTGTTVVHTLKAVDETLGPHLTEEENEILPIASAYMAPEEWAQLPGDALRTFAGDKPWLPLGLIREGLTDEQRSLMLAGMPVPLQQLWTDQWEPAFTSFIAAVRSIAPSA
jgi:hemerythrin-like domain-containing protein